MTLSREHYQAVADILRSERATANTFYGTTDATGAAVVHPERKEGWLAEIDRIEEALCTYFKSDNPAFKPDTFRKAAQP